jgi:hypothetical protein
VLLADAVAASVERATAIVESVISDDLEASLISDERYAHAPQRTRLPTVARPALAAGLPQGPGGPLESDQSPTRTAVAI